MLVAPLTAKSVRVLPSSFADRAAFLWMSGPFQRPEVPAGRLCKLPPTRPQLTASSSFGVNDLGADPAAKRILENRIPLVATPWLVDQGRSDLTMEQEVTQLRWADLFNDSDRAKARRRLSVAEERPPQ